MEDPRAVALITACFVLGQVYGCFCVFRRRK